MPASLGTRTLGSDGSQGPGRGQQLTAQAEQEQVEEKKKLEKGTMIITHHLLFVIYDALISRR